MIKCLDLEKKKEKKTKGREDQLLHGSIDDASSLLDCSGCHMLMSGSTSEG